MSEYENIEEFSRAPQSADYLIAGSASISGIPLPPPELRLYNESDADHLNGGAYDHSNILKALKEVGADPTTMCRVLEFGCADGRVLRHFIRDGGPELWGVDVDARRALWAHHNFGSKANIAVTTTAPHLPFPDAHFDLVYAISIFTHIDLTFMSWFAELARVTRNGGFGWLTIHDEKSIEIMNNEMNGNWFIDRIKNETKFREYGAADFDWFGVGDGDVFRNVFYRRAWIVERLAPMFKFLTAVERTTGGCQTALLLERV